MARVSNFPAKTDEGDAALQCRPARREEVDFALRLLLAHGGGLASNDQVLEFLNYAGPRGVDFNALWVAERGGTIEWSLLPMPNPGRTMLLLSPGRLFRTTPPASIRVLTDTVCREFGHRDIDLAQLLLDPAATDVQDVYASVGFQSLAQLVYLRRSVPQAWTPTTLPPGFELKAFAPELESFFMETITASYEGSLDCPGLNGLRDINDVLVGHRGTGEFVPALWNILLENGEPRAVLLLNRSAGSEAMELVYLGLVPAARGRQISDLMMRIACELTARDGRRELSLAVDSRNAPALKLYYRHGMQRIASRIAMIRDLRPLRDPQVP